MEHTAASRACLGSGYSPGEQGGVVGDPLSNLLEPCLTLGIKRQYLKISLGHLHVCAQECSVLWGSGECSCFHTSTPQNTLLSP